MSEPGCSSRSFYENFDTYDARSSCYDNMLVSDTEEEGNASDNHSEVVTDDERSVNQVCRCCGAELRGANSLNSLQNSVLYDYFPSSNQPSQQPSTSASSWAEQNMELVGPEDLPQYGRFFQLKLEERLSQVTAHIAAEVSRKEHNERRLKHALRENEELRSHLKQLQRRMHLFQDKMRTSDGTAV